MMKLAPRLLPLVGVAVAGVLVLKLAGGAEGVSGLFGARASAEEAGSAKGGRAKGTISTVRPKDAAAQTPVQTPGALPGLPDQSGANTTPSGPAVCAPSAAELAKEAGLSPAELQVIQTLGARRGQLDAREQALDTQLQLIAAAEQKLNGRIQAMNGLKGEIQALVGQADEKLQAEIDRLVTVYEKMPPKQAGPVMAMLDDRVRLPIAAKMKPGKLADILKSMTPVQAKELSESLAKRFNPTQSLQQILDGKGAQVAEAKPAATAAAAAAAPPSAAKEGAAETAPAATLATDQEKVKPASAKAPPRRQARAAPRPAKPMTVAKTDPPPSLPVKTPAKPAVDAAAVAAVGATAKPVAPPAKKPLAGPPA